MSCWTTDGVHHGKRICDLPFTYLLWFVGSHQMRRSRWGNCIVALKEIHRRLEGGTDLVEAELLADLRPKSISERLAMNTRRRNYRERFSKAYRMNKV